MTTFTPLNVAWAEAEFSTREREIAACRSWADYVAMKRRWAQRRKDACFTRATVTALMEDILRFRSGVAA